MNGDSGLAQLSRVFVLVFSCELSPLPLFTINNKMVLARAKQNA